MRSFAAAWGLGRGREITEVGSHTLEPTGIADRVGDWKDLRFLQDVGGTVAGVRMTAEPLRP